MARQLFHFIAGEQHAQAAASNVLDAWLQIERKPILAAEFRRLPVEAYDEAGNKLAVRPFDGWHDALMRDTYGDNWREVVRHAEELV
jgi:hypothetical protein